MLNKDSCIPVDSQLKWDFITAIEKFEWKDGKWKDYKHNSYIRLNKHYGSFPSYPVPFEEYCKERNVVFVGEGDTIQHRTISGNTYYYTCFDIKYSSAGDILFIDFNDPECGHCRLNMKDVTLHNTSDDVVPHSEFKVGDYFVVTKACSGIHGALDFCYKVYKENNTGREGVIPYSKNEAIGANVEIRRATLEEIAEYNKQGHPYDTALIKKTKSNIASIMENSTKYVKVIDNGKTYDTHPDALKYGATKYDYHHCIPNKAIAAIVCECLINDRIPGYVLEYQDKHYLIAKEGVIAVDAPDDQPISGVKNPSSTDKLFKDDLVTGKWYYGSAWTTNSCCKYIEVPIGSSISFNESYYPSSGYNSSGIKQSWCKCDYYTEVPQTVLDSFLPEGHPDRSDYKSKPFVLPKHWCIKPSNAEEDAVLKEWRGGGYSGRIGDAYLLSARYWSTGNLGYPEITFEQFKKYVLKEDVSTDLSGLPERWCVKLTQRVFDYLKGKYVVATGFHHSEMVSDTNNWSTSVVEGFTEITEEQFFKYVAKQSVSTDSYQLPEKWYIKAFRKEVYPRRYRILADWRDCGDYADAKEAGILLNSYSGDTGYWIPWGDVRAAKYVPITWEQFCKYVINKPELSTLEADIELREGSNSSESTPYATNPTTPEEAFRPTKSTDVYQVGGWVRALTDGGYSGDKVIPGNYYQVSCVGNTLVDIISGSGFHAMYTEFSESGSPEVEWVGMECPTTEHASLDTPRPKPLTAVEPSVEVYLIDVPKI